MAYVIPRAKIRRCGGQIGTSLAWRRLDEAIETRPEGSSRAAGISTFVLRVTSPDIELQSNELASDTAAVFVPHMGNGRFGRG